MNTCSNMTVSQSFEKDFLRLSLQKLIEKCDAYEIAPLFLEVLPSHQPILEAGCGSGRWCAWFRKQGWESTGLDWSEALCERARKEIDGVSFVSGDMQETPFPDGTFGSVVALGSVEHVPEGPVRALKEFHRILKPGGIAIITVPHGGSLRRMIRRLNIPARWLKARPWVRKWLNMPGADGRMLREAQVGCRRNWFPQFSCNEEGWSFFQYEFNRKQMRNFLTESGFVIEQEFASFADEGILHNFRRLAARWNEGACCVRLNPLGRFLQKSLPLEWYGHMLCYVVRRPAY